MKIKLPDAFFTPDSRIGFQPSGFSEEILQGKPDPAFPLSAEAANNASNPASQVDDEDYEILVALMEQTVELLSRFDPKMKYEVIEEEGEVQIQVINPRDGRVVRMISADEVIKLIAGLREELEGEMDDSWT
ncbi:MAG: flagellar protein FlaG [Synergistaceae bacterium]|jgi:uncharacterized FlaG/YvyC family protein|nr:flagellar protein FlaG [Synergistaceae bacterium]